MTSSLCTRFLSFYHFLMLLPVRSLPLLQEVVLACKHQVWLRWTEQVDVDSWGIWGICPSWSDDHALMDNGQGR